MVPSYARPIRIPNPELINVVTAAKTAEAVPAICPRGSMALAVQFPNKIPKQKKTIIKKDIRSHSGGCPLKAKAVNKNTMEVTVSAV